MFAYRMKIQSKDQKYSVASSETYGSPGHDYRLSWIFIAVGFILLAGYEWFCFQSGLTSGSDIIPFIIRICFDITVLLTGVVLLILSNRKNFFLLLKKDGEKLFGFIEAFNGALYLKDNYTGDHGQRVAAYARTICFALELTIEECKTIYQAALLHDIGKIGIPDQILNKPDPLTNFEWSFIHSHPRDGYNLLKQQESLKALAPLVLYHHEQYSGGGYPEGLSGEEIPIGSRIITIADALDAMTSDRVYVPKVSFETAIERLIHGNLTIYDPSIIKTILVSKTLKRIRKIYDIFNSETIFQKDSNWYQEIFFTVLLDK